MIKEYLNDQLKLEPQRKTTLEIVVKYFSSKSKVGNKKFDVYKLCEDLLENKVSYCIIVVESKDWS